MNLELYDREGKPMDDTSEWARRHEDLAYHYVAETPVGDVRVSTIWTGISVDIEGPPLIFETKVFGLEGDEMAQWRYPTEAEARAGHEAAVRWVHDGCPPEEEP